MFNKLASIAEGWKNYVFPSKDIEALAKDRAEHCASCEEAVKAKFEVITDNRIKVIENFICNHCKCPLTTKLRSQSESCPLQKW